jgi:hypothetical protein
MAERYIRQSDFTNAVYLPDCPVTLEKGAVLLDTKTNTYNMQLKFANVGTEEIKSARIYFEAVDNAGKSAYPGIYADYDEPTAAGGNFGAKKLIPLPNNNAAEFKVYVEKITAGAGDANSYPRDQYEAVAKDAAPDITAEREEVFAEERKKREHLEKVRRTMQGVKWFHIVFAASLLLLLLIYLLTPGMPLPLMILVAPWIAVGIIGFRQPKINMLSLITAFALPLLSFIALMFVFGIIGQFIVAVLISAVSFAPFICIFFSVRRHDSSLEFIKTLMFWKK